MEEAAGDAMMPSLVEVQQQDMVIISLIGITKKSIRKD